MTDPQRDPAARRFNVLLWVFLVVAIVGFLIAAASAWSAWGGATGADATRFLGVAFPSLLYQFAAGLVLLVVGVIGVMISVLSRSD